MAKIYTRTGDDGTTGLGTAERTQKNSKRIEAYGSIDEVNSWIGLIRSKTNSKYPFLETIQNQLFCVGTELANPNKIWITKEMTSKIEEEIDILEKNLQPLKNFILPAGGENASIIHITRTICRRAERSIVTLNQETPVNPEIIKYINRLSDYLFVLARSEATEETIWKV
ncbi:Cobalamin adenosyltransferase [uncultured archaeon]|nr:Cobalamin adenosyltransferase [uncultured archaeon]